MVYRRSNKTFRNTTYRKRYVRMKTRRSRYVKRFAKKSGVKKAYKSLSTRTYGQNVTGMNNLKCFKDSVTETLRYVTGYNISTNGTTETSYANAIRMDSIYDPDVLNAGRNTEVDWYSKLATLYSRYKVYGFDAIVKFQNKSDITTIVFVGSCDSTQWTAAYGVSMYTSSLVARPEVKYMILGPKGSSNDHCTLTFKQLPREVLGLSKTTWAGDSSYGAAFGANPSNDIGRQPYFIFGIGHCVDGSVNALNVDVNVTCGYFTTMTVLKEDAPDET